MQALGAYRRLTTWIAILAVLMSSLAPAISQAVSKASGTNWVELCTAQGSKWVQSGDDGAERQPGSAHAAEHCPFCSLQTPTPGLPPATDLAHRPVVSGQEAPPAFLAAPRTLHAWVCAQPRAPPLFS